MCLTGRAVAAATLAVSMACAGSVPPPATQPSASPRPTPAVPEKPTGADAPTTAAVVMTGSLSGTVRGEGGKPLARARVTLTSPALTDPRVTITTKTGEYILGNIPSGVYSIGVTRTGYAPQQFGERRSAPPATVPVAAGQKVTGIDLTLIPAGVVAGQILDEDGAPFAGARVSALISRVEKGQSTLVAVSTAETDDRGEFRLIGLPPGQYFVSAFDPAFETVGDETGSLTYTATYYPGVASAEEARRVTVNAGTDPTAKIVFPLQIIRPARVSGIIASADKRQLISGAVIMSPIHGEGLVTVPSRDVTILPDGSFAFRNVAPGRYQIRARGELEPQGTALFATYTISLSGHDISNLDLLLAPGASLDGRVIIEASRPLKAATLTGLRVRAPFADGSSFGDALTGDVISDGSFRIRGLMTGDHYITVEGLQYPWTLRSVTYKGQEIADAVIDVEGDQEFKDVRVLITDSAAELAGIVRDERGRGAADAMVLVIPAAPQFWARTSRRFGLLRTDANGRYRIRGLPSGQYHAVATFDLDESEAYRRDILQDLVDIGLPITIIGSEQRTLDLALLSLATGRRTVAR